MPTSSGAIPRPEYPRPQFARARWLNLNGEWEFEFDPGDSGLERGLLKRGLTDKIVVPFAPESELSGIGAPDFHEAVWYRRRVDIPEDWSQDRLLLHFQAVDHDATVWVNGTEVGRHRGGFTSFTFDITNQITASRQAEIVVRARDSRTAVQARGKQATWYANSHCYYTRTTGIWQTVWFEPVPTTYLLRPRVTPDVANSLFHVEITVRGPSQGFSIAAELFDDDGLVSTQRTNISSQMDGHLFLPVDEARRRLWSLEDPFLYRLKIRLRDSSDKDVDQLDCYCGLRAVSTRGRSILLNGQPVFLRLVLDQGYWPDGIMTAPNDQALIDDIILAKAAGFNGARIHERVPEERLLFHADRLGYLVWEEFGDWGAAGQGPAGENQQPTPSFIGQWIEAVNRDYSHPAIVGWCPLNETHQVLHDRITTLDDVTGAMFWATKSVDRTRPVIDASGYSHRVREADVWDSHDYQQDPETVRKRHQRSGQDEPLANTAPDGTPYSVPYAGQPILVSEFGGIWWSPQDASGGANGDDQSNSWGYGLRVEAEEDFYARFEGLIRALDQNPAIAGYCYTQLTDVFQEKNGLYGFGRGMKLDIERLHSIQTGTRRPTEASADDLPQI
ncbi:MAG: beta-galactosidase [Bifidobacteriaceae bacterium]|jgi:beta-galactosidase/beta-glucuronidase|nr:beta-galactosidase [Bifidobacteriaceae bacterium]